MTQIQDEESDTNGFLDDIEKEAPNYYSLDLLKLSKVPADHNIYLG